MPLTINAQIRPLVRGGVVASTHSEIGDFAGNNHMTLSYTLGTSLIIPLNDVVSLQPELNFIRKGRYDQDCSGGISTESTKSADYLQLPLLIKFTPSYFSDDAKTKVFFNFGPYGSVLLGAKERIEIGSSSATNSVKDSYSNYDFGLVIGVGVQIPINTKALQFDLRYDMGFKDITKDSDSYNTKAITLGVGFLF